MDAYKSLTTLQNFLKIFSLHHINLSKPGLINNLGSFIKVALILFTFGCLTSYNLYRRFSDLIMRSLSPSVVVIDAVGCALCYCEYIVDLWFIYKYRNHINAYYYNFDQMDAVFNMKYNEDIKQSAIILLATVVSSWFIASVGQFGVWAAAAGWGSSASYSATYLLVLIRLLTCLDFTFQAMHIRLRLKAISDHINECASFAEDSPYRMKTIWNITGKYVKVLPCIFKSRCGIKIFSSCYLLLIEQTKFLNIFYGVRILMHCLYTLTELLTLVNFVAKALSGSLSLVVTSYILLAPNILRIINCIAVLNILVHSCETCRQQTGDIIHAIDHYLVNKNTSEELVSSLKTLRKLITTRPLKFSVAGFFNLESTLLLSLISVVITYALILLQTQ